MSRWAFRLAVLAILAARLVQHARLVGSGFVGLTADEYSRVLLASGWSRQPYLPTHGEWLPLHMVIYGGWLRVYHDLYAAPVALTAALGLVSVGLAVATGARLGGRGAGLVAGMLILLNPAHLWLSSTPLTEMLYTVLVQAMLLALLTLMAPDTPIPRARWVTFLASAAVLGLTATRLEGWVWAGLLTALAALFAWRPGLAPGTSGRAVRWIAIAAWMFPLYWMAGSYAAQGSPLAFMGDLSAYKERWYDPAAGGYWRYVQHAVALDLISVGVLAGFVAFLIIRWLRDRKSFGRYLGMPHEALPVRALYFLAVLLPPMAFVVLHHGQPEPPGNYIRYLGPYLFVAAPMASLGWMELTGQSRSERGRRLAYGTLLACLGVFAAWRIAKPPRPPDEPAGEGIVQGRWITGWRMGYAHESSPAPDVLVELRYWQFLSLQVGADDDQRILFDRKADLARREIQSMFTTDPATAKACLGQHGVGLIGLVDPELRTIVSRDLGFTMVDEVAGMAFYEPTDPLPDFPGSPPCPLPRGFAELVSGAGSD